MSTAHPLRPDGAIRLRYIGLSAAFGLLFGIRYTLDVWIFGRYFPSSRWKFGYVGLGFAGMLAGELLSPWLASGGRFRRALRCASILLFVWSMALAYVVSGGNAWLMLPASAAFGCGLGLFHSLLDSWVDNATRESLFRPAGDGLLLFGFGVYSVGIMATSVLAFPMLYAFEWSRRLNEEAQRMAMTATPFFVAAGIATLIGAFAPSNVHPTGNSPTSKRGGMLRFLVAGGTPLWFSILLASGVSILIQYVDYFAPDLVTGATVLAKTQNIGLLNAIVAASSVVLGGVLLHRYPLRNLPWQKRTALLSVSLIIVAALVGVVAATASERGLLIAGLLGATQAILVLLPAPIKAMVMEHSPSGSQTSGVALLGAGKRIAAIACSAVLFLAAPSGPSSSIYFVFVLIAVVCFGASLLSTWGWRRRRTIDVS